MCQFQQNEFLQRKNNFIAVHCVNAAVQIAQETSQKPATKRLAQQLRNELEKVLIPSFFNCRPSVGECANRIHRKATTRFLTFITRLRKVSILYDYIFDNQYILLHKYRFSCIPNSWRTKPLQIMFNIKPMSAIQASLKW